MSEYQYYEFQAIDRPLSEADRAALRKTSTRARITARSFTNDYQWGDFKGDPVKLMERWFDLHLHLSNWGTRRLMIRLPERLVDATRLARLLRATDSAQLTAAGGNLIVDIVREELEDDGHWTEEGEDDSDWLANMAPLRAEILGGDLRLFYLLWLMAIEDEAVEADEIEPFPGLGPITGALETFADFFCIDADLVAAAAERVLYDEPPQANSPEAAKAVVAALPEQEKTALLLRLIEGDPHVADELRIHVRAQRTSQTPAAVTAVPQRTAGELRARADAIREAREQAEADRLAAERRKQAEKEARVRRAELDAIVRRGDDVWREVETEIERRNERGYLKALDLLLALQTLAEERGTETDYDARVRSIHERHARKPRFIERLRALE